VAKSTRTLVPQACVGRCRKPPLKHLFCWFALAVEFLQHRAASGDSCHQATRWGRQTACPSRRYSPSGLNPFGRRGGSSALAALQRGRGAPAAPQAHACGPAHGWSGWFSQTQPPPEPRTHRKEPSMRSYVGCRGRRAGRQRCAADMSSWYHWRRD